MDELIPLVNELQDALTCSENMLALDLPQIAVVGSQSAGKSSVLENIVGKDFLPRGVGIVTRRPLLLQLVKTDQDVEYGTFLHRKEEKFTDFSKMRVEIEMETEKMSGAGKAISPVPINLRLYGPNYVNLTLVDLPGLTKVPVEDQPEDIELQVRTMILSYIERPTCLILAVCPANADLATSDALQMAQMVDPEGTRTIGVVTKIDLMDAGTDARAILENKVIPIAYGYVGVVNRSHKDILGCKNVSSALEAETIFFQNHSSYKDLSDHVGTKCLIKRLNEHLTMHIAQVLPDFKSLLRKRFHELDMQLKRLPCQFDYDDPFWKPKTMVILVVQFAQLFKIELLGLSEAGLNLDSYSTGAQIMKIFHEHYKEKLFATEFTHEAAMKLEIGYAIQNILGVRTGLFTPDKAFDLVIRNQIKKLHQPTIWVVDEVAEGLLHALHMITEQAFNHFPLLAKEMHSKCQFIIYQFAATSTERVNELLEYELAYINTKHEDFVGFSYAEQKAYSRVQKRRHPGMQVTQKSHLLMAKRRLWFTLTTDALCWYSDETENERLYMVPIEENLRFRDEHFSNKFYISKTNGNIYLDKKEIELQAVSVDDLERWKKSFLQIGIVMDNEDGNECIEQTVSGEILDEHDPWLERQIESIWILTFSYMNIVCTTLLDIVPKCVVRTLIKESVTHFETNLVAEVSRLSNYDDLMQENNVDLKKRESLKQSLQACQLALDKLARIDMPAVAAKIPLRRGTNLPQRPLNPRRFSGKEINKNKSIIGSKPIDQKTSPRAQEAIKTRRSSTDQSNTVFSIKSKNGRRELNETVVKSITSDNRAKWHLED